MAIEGVGMPSHWSNNEHDTVEELNQRLTDTTWELQTFHINAKEELMKKEGYIQSLIHLIEETSQQRDEARNQLQFLLSNPNILQTEGNSNNLESGYISDNHSINISDSCHISEYDEDNARLEELFRNRPLPKKGKLLEAVMEAGPSPQDLLVADSLPQLKNPINQHVQIPAVLVKGRNVHTLNQTAALSSHPFMQSSLNDLHNAFPQGLWSSAKRQRLGEV